VTTSTHIGTVTRVDSMHKTVRVSRKILVWYVPFKKHYLRDLHVFVHDPHNLLVEGDVIRYGEFPPSLRARRDSRNQKVISRKRPTDRNGMVREKGVRFMVREIVTPFGVPLEQRTSRVVGSEPGRWAGTSGAYKQPTLRKKGQRREGMKKPKKPSEATAKAANDNRVKKITKVPGVEEEINTATI
jgi:ribosomal protein S17